MSDGQPLKMQEKWRIEVPEWVRAVAISPDSNQAAVGDASGHLTVVDIDGGHSEVQSQLYDVPITHLHWPNDDLLVVAAEDGSVEAINVGDVKHPRSLHSAKGPWVEDLMVDADHGLLATCSGPRATVLDVDGQTIFETPEHDSTVSGLAFLSSPQPMLVSAFYGGIAIWDVSRGESKHMFEWKGSMLKPHPSPDGNIVACGCQDNSVHFWRLSEGQDSQMAGYPGKPRLLDWSEDGQFLGTAASSVLMIWDFSGDGPEGTYPRVLEQHRAPITAMTSSPGVEPAWVTGDELGMVLSWDSSNNSEPRSFAGLGGEVTVLEPLAQGRELLAGDARGNLHCYRSR